MATFGTASFDVLLDNDGRLPAWQRDPGVVIEPVPYANADHVQFRGRGSPRLRLHIAVETDWDWSILQSYLGDGVPKTLGDPFGLGESHANMCLVALSGARLAWTEDWDADAEFIQVSVS